MREAKVSRYIGVVVRNLGEVSFLVRKGGGGGGAGYN
jgi:hypothetical protein